ncbi:spinster family MFS transporter [Ketobacter alkanivorans]|uniref:MFS transporter n=1 Tax=Ketobacter alkanivorans TaxID=1917421 RepID=A0A2K9LKB9_9GAMM|nr:MFS transporter [Ketobacter alkanivorans]AUM12703.1 MFS transporter [Ketobacter alkanivorans]
MPVSYPGSARAWLTVAILMLAYVLSFIDRQILNLLVGPIRRDLAISDTEMSLLMGFSFALFYTLCGIPLGRMADRTSRRGLIAAGILVWSAMTAACGLAKQYWHFLFARVGVGAGEAALSPAAYSLIADSFPPHQRATAISVYSMGIYVGSGLAFLLGGLVIHFASAQGDIDLPVIGMIRPWQLIFLILGAAGVMFCLLLLFLKEPVRQGAGVGVEVSFAEVLAYIKLNRKTVLLHNLSFACVAFCSYGASSWVPAFFMRTFAMDAAEVGFIYGILIGVFGSLGIIVGGRLSDWLTSRGYKDAPMRVGLVAVVIALPSFVGYAIDSLPVAIACIGVGCFALAMPFGVAPAAIQEIMPNPMRGQASAMYLFVVTIIGLGVGPTAVALLTDFVFQDDNALRYSLLIISVVSTLLAIALLLASLRPYRESVERAGQWGQ